MAKLNPRQRLSKARINLLTNFPFYGSVAMHLILRELTPQEIKAFGCDTMGVDLYGNLVFNPAFVEKTSDEDLKVIMAHEVLHVCLMHLKRIGTRQPKTWNYATDSAVNDILSKAFTLPQKCVLFKDFRNKGAEETYDWLIRNAKTQNLKQYVRFDKHFYDKGKGKKGKKGSAISRKGQQKIDPARVVKEAWNFARRQGKLPGGLERIFADILNPAMDWREILRKYLVSILPHNFTYTRPSKKSQSAGFYMPTVTREFIDIVVGVDSSGSVSEKEYAQFLSEIAGMVKQFESLRATVLVCDAGIQNIVEIDNAFDPYAFKGRGYGGTSSLPVYKWIEDNKNNNIKLLVYFTDGWIDIPKEPRQFPTLWVVTAAGRVETVNKQQNAIVVKIPKEHP